jgi:rod shape-determining protein MreD
MAKHVIWAGAFALVAALLESTLFARIAVYRTVPDLVLGIVVYSAYVNGPMTGQLTGFFSGLLLDCLSAAPLGLNAFTGALAGVLAGSLRGTFFLDAFFLPMALCAGATVLKGAVFFLLRLLFAGAVPAYTLSGPVFWLELLFNTLLAPFMFALLKRFGPLLSGERGGAA